MKCRHGDWNLVFCHQAGVRGCSRSLGRFSFPILLSSRKRLSVSGLATTEAQLPVCPSLAHDSGILPNMLALEGASRPFAKYASEK
jgi:hypothetical protein